MIQENSLWRGPLTHPFQNKIKKNKKTKLPSRYATQQIQSHGDKQGELVVRSLQTQQEDAPPTRSSPLVPAALSPQARWGVFI